MEPIDAALVTSIGLLAGPAAAFAFLAGVGASGRRPRERPVVALVGVALSLATVTASLVLGALLTGSLESARVPLGSWFAVGHHQLDLELVLDPLALTFALLGAVLSGLVAAFSRRYLHQEPGFLRFYALLCLLAFGFEVAVLAGNLEFLIFGWELVGVSSALLIAFFHHRAGPVRHGLRAFTTYRACDVALLTALIWLHHETGSASLDLAGHAAHAVSQSGVRTTIIGLLLVIGTMGKSAQYPLTGWLPRAMEGPTPSSAVFYGALSVHLGPYLLLRAAPLLRATPVLPVIIVAVGLATVGHATFVGRVQTDIKSALAYASATQVGLIYVEIGLGWDELALTHIIGHSAVRTLQILRSPSLLHEHHQLEQAMGSYLPRTGRHLERLVPQRWQPALYRHALNRGHADAFFVTMIATPARWLLSSMERAERAWLRMLAAAPPQSRDRDVDESTDRGER